MRSVRAVTRVSNDESFDLVLLSCKAYDLESAIEAIAPAVEAGALVLPFLNGLGVYEKLDARFGRSHGLGGVAYIGASCNVDGVVTRMGPTDRVIVGAREPSGAAIARRIHELLARGGGARGLSDSIEQELWNKRVMLAARAAVTCLMRGTIRDIHQSLHDHALV